MSQNILVAVAWPYASGSLHLGHLAGAYLPADIFARYHRLAGDKVLMVSGSDGHGTPITVRADQEGTSPQAIVDRYHPEILGYWESVGISFDLFTTTLTENHRQVTWDIFRAHRARGTIVEGESLQFYDPEAERFLPDRYVEGTCPHCGYSQARGDQCDNCGRTLDPTDLLNPRSRLSGATPVQRSTKHWFLRLGAFADDVKAWLESKTGWRRHVKNWALGMIEEGLPEEEPVDRVVLDLPEPWTLTRAVAAALRPGGIFVSYVPTIIQSQQVAEALQRERTWALVETFETLFRPWNIEGLSVRPFHRMVAHTGFITVARRVVPEEGAPAGAHARDPQRDD